MPLRFRIRPASLRVIVPAALIHAHDRPPLGSAFRPARRAASSQPLLAAIRDLAPELVAISGDLTQRARRNQFAEARAFLQSLEHPYLVVPGNHDVPLYDVARRFLRPLARYRQFVADDLEPVHVDDEIAVIGLNSARSLTFGRGRLNASQIGRADRAPARRRSAR